MQIEVISTVEGVEQLKAPWDELYSRSNATVFMHHSWICKSYKYIPPLEIVLIAVYGDKKKLLGVFPFAIEDFRIKGIKCKVLTGGGSGLSDYCSFLIDPDSNIRLMIGRVIEHLLIMQNERWDYFKYDRLSDKDPTADLFRHLLKKHLYGGDFSSEVTPRVDFHYAYEDAKKVGNVKRRFKKVLLHSSLTHQIGAEIDSISGGLSSAKVLRVTLLNNKGIPFHYALAKIDNHNDIDIDDYNFSVHINKLPVGSFPTLLDKYYAGCGNKKGIFYQ